MTSSSAYLVHGFRWPRKAIREHTIYNNIDDAVPEYIVVPESAAAFKESFQQLYPAAMNALPELHFVEQYDPLDTSKHATSQPYAFVADKIEVCRLSVSVNAAMHKGVPQGGWDALVDLRDHIAPGEQVGWWVVHNGDVQRPVASSDDSVSRCDPSRFVFSKC